IHTPTPDGAPACVATIGPQSIADPESWGACTGDSAGRPNPDRSKCGSLGATARDGMPTPCPQVPHRGSRYQSHHSSNPGLVPFLPIGSMYKKTANLQM